MWDLPRPGIKPMSPALAGGLFTTEPPRKPSLVCILSIEIQWNNKGPDSLVSKSWVLINARLSSSSFSPSCLRFPETYVSLKFPPDQCHECGTGADSKCWSHLLFWFSSLALRLSLRINCVWLHTSCWLGRMFCVNFLTTIQETHLLSETRPLTWNPCQSSLS